MQEESETYITLANDSIEEKYKEIVEYLFKDKERICFLINRFLNNDEKLTRLKHIEFAKCRNGIKTIYKQLDKQVFYIIIYQREIFIDLPYMILQECVKIIQNCKTRNVKKIMIIPIVIFVKENRYHKAKTMKQYFEITTYDNHILKLKYNLVNVSNFLKQAKMRNTILEDLIYLKH